MITQNVRKFLIARRGCAIALLGALTLMTGCGGSGGSGTGSNSTTPPVNNTQAVQVNLGPTNNDANVLFTNVTICVPGTTNCQTIQDVQVDTGSEGLRILSSQLALSLPSVSDANGNPIGNCVTFADNSYVWGPVMTADVQMAGEKASSVPVQVIGQPNFPAVPSSCNSGGAADNTVAALGANAIIGLGVFRHDCGSACSGSVSSAPPNYFDCPATGCSVTSVALQNQLQNPVWLFPQDNNGLLISLPSISDTGAPTVSGSMIFGIGTQSDNALGAAGVYTTDVNGNFSTTFNGSTYSSSYIDSGSNGIFFLDSSTIGLPPCTNSTGFSCPSSTVTYTAVNAGTNGTSGQVTFSIANADSLFNSANSAFNDVGGPDTGQFDWGLPFFFGRNLFVAINGQNTPAGSGPYWAY
ncbi:MAG TPA: DUF3443 domain-containing protein [Terriglobia bacterium]|nr:DUF3443 domain-containing protein [Terriglobia bacterium]